jgi:predicted HicB family RNase H-like nuclease
MDTALAGLKALNVRVPAELHKAVKILAVEQERPVQDLAEEAIRDLLTKYGKGADHA